MRIVIIGNGVAGVSVAETIRKEDKESGITILSDENYPFYSRPRLIEVLAGKSSAGQIVIHSGSWYEKNGIDLRLGSQVTGIDTARGKVIDQSGGSVFYDTLVIAAGASCRVPPVPGIDGDRVFTLRSIADAEKIRAFAATRKNAVIIGGGLSGIESAFALVSLGLTVTVVEVFDRLLPHQLDHEGSALLRGLLEARGLSFVTGARVKSISRNADGVAVATGNAAPLTSDFVVVAAGIKPHTSIVKDTAIAHNRAIIVDEGMRTSCPGIYACGDGAECGGTIYGLWQPAREQGIVCGNRILGHETAFAGSVPSARLKVAGIEFASVGSIVGDEGVVQVRDKDDAAGTYRNLFIRDKKLVGAILIGNVKETTALQSKIRTGEEYNE
jgi:nitrite reductase (NADH) large subunit